MSECTDPLTEIYSRRSLDDIASRFISHAKRLGNPLTFLMVDVNNFKQVNTKFGHLTGDAVLSEFAVLLKTSIRGSDAVVRYGGDEFLILLADTTTVGSERVIDRINQHLAEWNKVGNLQGFQLSASIGVAEWHDGESLDELLDAADQRMYQHKTQQCSPRTIRYAVVDVIPVLSATISSPTSFGVAVNAIRKDTSAEIAALSGGEIVYFRDELELETRLSMLAGDIHNGYSLSLNPSSHGEGFHTITVQVVKGDPTQVVARRIYWCNPTTAEQ